MQRKIKKKGEKLLSSDGINYYTRKKMILEKYYYLLSKA